MADFPNREELIADFCRWVRISSPSGQEAKIRKAVAAELTKLGANTTIDHAGNLLGKFKAFHWQGAPQDIRILCAHLDTVNPGTGIEPLVNKDRITSSGNTILGADDKDGLTVILAALRHIKAKKLSHPSLEILFTVREEEGTGGSRTLRPGRLKATSGWVFDGCGRVGTIYKGALGATKFTVNIIGRSAHAASDPEKGINALQAAAVAISRIPVGRPEPDLTVNIGVIHAGTAVNIVPDTAIIQGETRSTSTAAIHRSLAKIKTGFSSTAKAFRAKLKFSSTFAYPPFSLARQAEIVRFTEKIAAEAGFKPEIKEIKAGTDANHLNRIGIPSVIIAMGRRNNHTIRESTTGTNLFRAARLAIALITAQYEL